MYNAKSANVWKVVYIQLALKKSEIANVLVKIHKITSRYLYEKEKKQMLVQIA